MKRTGWVAGCTLGALAVVGCGEIDPVGAPELDTGSADFTRLVAVGNSLTAGVQGLGLVESHQRRAYAAQIARQLGKPVYTSLGQIPDEDGDMVPDPAPEAFVIPGWGAPGSPGTLQLVRLSPPTIEPLPPQEAGAPVNLQYPGIYNNLGISGAGLNEIIHETGGPPASPFTLVLRGQGTALQIALALQPTFVLLWAGSNDALGAVTAAQPSRLTPLADFERDFRIIMNAFLGDPGSPERNTPTGSEPRPGMVCANIPDVTSIPFVTTVPPIVDGPGGLRLPLLGPDGFLTEDDFVTLLAQALIEEGYGFPEDADLNGDMIPDGKGALPDSVVLSREEANAIQERIEDFNAVIAEVAAEHGIAVVDVNRILRTVARDGIPVGGIHYDPRYILGGLFSLDGVHLTDVGQALLANEFITTINAAYGAAIPPVNLASVMGLSFGVGGVGVPETWFGPLGTLELDLGEGLKRLLRAHSSRAGTPG